MSEATIRLLLVEDDKVEAHLVRAMLAAAIAPEIECAHVTSLKQALAFLDGEHPDIALLDLTLPDSAGLATLRALRAKAPTLPVVILTGHEDEDAGAEAVRLGASDYLLKGEGAARMVVRSVRYALARDVHTRDLLRRAHYDLLTGLPNRSLFQDRLHLSLARARRGGGGGFAVLAIDLDHFKPVNDHFGHAAGDEVLRDVAQRLTGCVRQCDTVARIGGDEFIVLTEGLADHAAAATIAEKALAALALPFAVGEGDAVISASIGIAMFPSHGATTDELLAVADAAVYRAKRAGRNRIFLGITPLPLALAD